MDEWMAQAKASGDPSQVRRIQTERMKTEAERILANLDGPEEG